MIGRVDLSGGATGGYYERMYYVKDHPPRRAGLGSIRVGISSVTTANNNITYASDYYPYGETLREYTSGSNKYKFTEKERDNETSYDYGACPDRTLGRIGGARYYNNKLGVWLSADPLAEKYPGWTPYKYGLDNPVRFYDPDGKDEKERKAAIARAEQFVAANPTQKDKSLYGFMPMDQIAPGKKVDCSGLVDNAVYQTGLGHINKGNSNGVKNEISQSIKIDFNKMEEGNVVSFRNDKHIAIIKSIVKNEDGQISSITIIHSSSSYGPHETTINMNGKNKGEAEYWKDNLQKDGVYKWDSWEGGTLSTVEVVGKDKSESQNESGTK